MSDSPRKDLDTALEAVSADRRSFLRKVVLTTAFTAPIVASFAVDGMLVGAMASPAPNSSNSS